ncbi:putative flavin-containing amine oxidase [Massariosphaeria phaeospora]|uniref:Amine oxidase n=1 Tax=Massariosphaeria phaeospora TaxID=100035 RepID=A0A7C8MRB9_9PLEO|nr:putative flavin-containing amine oxidase [Massariosphaeria phaeospora]
MGNSKLQIGIVGGGASGIYSALLLQREGHSVTLFEATERLGGRIYTHHFQPQTPNEDPLFEVGAMRLPDSSRHEIVFDFVNYLNTHQGRQDKINLIPFVMSHENNITFVDGKQRSYTGTHLESNVGLPKEFQGISAQKLLEGIILPWTAILEGDFESGFRAVLEYDGWSFRTYLNSVENWPHEVIDFVEMIASQTNQFDLSFTEVIMQCLDFGTQEWFTVRGGMSRMVDTAASVIGSQHINLNMPIKYIMELDNGRVCLSTGCPSSTKWVFDKIILAILASSLQSVLERPRWDMKKEQAIRSTYFEPLYKMGLHFKVRFWEHGKKPIFGGQSVTDLRIRRIIYPSTDLGSRGSGVLILYAWMTDAARWYALSSQERIDVALYELGKIHTKADCGFDVTECFIEALDMNWAGHSSTGGCMYLPGQFSRFHEVMGRPEGPIFFAGERLSKHHAWIAGAMDSAYNTVREVLGCRDIHTLGMLTGNVKAML